MFKGLKKKIRKWVGLSTASAVAASLLIAVTPSVAQATETTSVPIPTEVTLTTTSSSPSNVEVTATWNEPLEKSSSALTLFKIGSSTPVDTVISGTSKSFTIPRPTSANYEQYYVKVADLTSNSVTVHSNNSGVWELSITSNVSTFKTSDANPIITWSTNQSVKDTANTGVFIAEKATGSIVHKVWNATTSGTSPVTKFYAEPRKEYIAYIADWTNTANSSLNVSMLTNVKTVSNSLFIYHTPWNVQLTTDRQTFSTEDTTPKLTWVINQPLSTSGNAVYIYNTDTGAILNRITSGSVLTYTYTITRQTYGDPQNFKALIAPNNSTATNINALIGIKTESNQVTITRAAWNLSISSNLPYYYEGETNPVLTWTTNQKVQSSNNNYKVYIANKNTGAILYTSHGKFTTAQNTATFTIPNFNPQDASNEYVAYVAQQGTPSNVSQLVDVQTTSNIVLLERYAWAVELTADRNVYSTSDPTPILGWSTNQTIANPYKLYIVDSNNNEIVRTVGASTSYTGTVTAPRPRNGDNKVYVAYIANSTVSTPTLLSQLTDIQATSNPLEIGRLPWVSSMEVDNAVYKTDDERPTMFFQTNQSLGTANSDYAFHLVDETTGAVVGRVNGFEPGTVAQTGSVRIPKFYSGGAHEFKGYIAKYTGLGSIPTHVSQLEDVQTTTNIVTVIRHPWEISLGIDRTIFSTDDSTPKVSWTTNQSVHDANDAYEVYIVNSETGEILHKTNNEISHRSGNYTIQRFYTGGSKAYQAYVAAWDFTATNVNDLEDIQAVSNIVGTQRAQWGIALQYEITGVDETINKKRIEFTWHANQSLSYTNNNYQLYLFNNSTKELIYTRSLDSTGKHALATEINAQETFIAYVAKKDSSVTNINNLSDIQAVSTAVFPEETSVTVKAEEYAGGGNPSTADCNQQCYGDPVNSYNGEFFENSTDLSINALVPFDFTRTYSTWNKDENRGLGKGWRHNYDMYLEGDGASLASSSYIKIHQENGSTVTFAKITVNNETYYIGSNNIRAKFSYDALANKFVFDRANGYTFLFSTSNGKLQELKDRNGNNLTLTYTGTNLTNITASSGQTLTLAWSSNKLASITDGTRTVTYTYSNNLLSIIDLPETTGHKQYTYDTADRVKRIIHPNGGWYENFYDNDHRVAKQVNPLNGETLFSYQTPTAGNITTITLPDGTQNREKYNRLGQLIEQKLGYGSSLEKTFTYEYDFTGEKSKETGPSGVLATYTHDNNGNITTVKDPLNRVTHFTYNQFNQILTTTDALNNVTINVYDETGNLLTTTTPEGHVTEFDTNANGTANSITSPNDVNNDTGKKTLFSYDTNSWLTTVTQPEGSTTTVTNNTIGNPLSVQSALNKITQYVYNTNQQVIETIAPNLESSTVEYDNAGQVQKTIDSLGRETTYTYDLMGNVLTVTNAYGTVAYEYDNMQKVTLITDVDGAETAYEYNTLGQPIIITDALGNETTMTYYNHGLVETVTDARGNTITYEYDAAGNTVKIIDDNNNESVAVYDALNRVTSSTSSNGYTEAYTFDKDGNLTSSTRAGIETTNYQYDANGNLVKTIYPDNSFEQRTYDSDDQLLSIQDRDGKITSYQYDAEGKVVKTVRSDSSEVQYSYTILGQLDQVSYDNWVTVDTDYNYDVHGRVTSETKTGVTTTYSYDAIGNMTRRGPPTGSGVEYNYNQYGTIEGITYPSGIEVEYTHDLNGNLKNVKKDNQIVASYAYDQVGNLTRADYGNGTFELNQYDNLNRLTSISLNNNAGEFYKKQLELDNAGLIIGGNTKVGSSTVEDKEYDYTAVQRLQNVTDTLTSTNKAYSFDTSSNLTSSPWGSSDVTPNGKITASTLQSNNVSYTHDNRGNRTDKTVTNSATLNKTSSTSYIWSVDNKLDQYVKTATEVTDSVTQENKTTVGYDYDANGLLTQRQASTTSTTYTNGSPASQSNSTSPTETFIWDTLNSVPTLLEDKTDSFLYGVSSVPFAQVDKTTGGIEYLHGDERGSIIAASIETGAYSWYQKYDEYGFETTKVSQSGVQQIETRFAYAGEYQDPTTGLYNLRARWYEPETASFLNVDPALGSTGEAYSYASANPLTFTDPLGLFSLTDWQNFGYGLSGFMDGVTIIPIASTISNWISPGSVKLCSPIYQNAQEWGTFASLGLGAGGIVAKISFGIVKKLTTKQLPKLIYDFKKMPVTSQHKLEALNIWVKAGQKNKFTAISQNALTPSLKDPTKMTNWVRQNRGVTTAPLKKVKGGWNDEFPLASTKQGGVYARNLGLGSVRKAPKAEQIMEGNMIKSFYNQTYNFDYQIAFKNVPSQYKHLLIKGINEV